MPHYLNLFICPSLHKVKIGCAYFAARDEVTSLLHVLSCDVCAFQACKLPMYITYIVLLLHVPKRYEVPFP